MHFNGACARIEEGPTNYEIKNGKVKSKNVTSDVLANQHIESVPIEDCMRETDG